MILMLSLPIFNPQASFQGPTGRRNDESDFDFHDLRLWTIGRTEVSQRPIHSDSSDRRLTSDQILTQEN
jgi:hypothetical protein